ncbi:5-oxoprolinase subunit PxpA [Leucothrix sargassi]|nr:5-oxoprolinase subunit PxpA [Leucothrix sargassi]
MTLKLNSDLGESFGSWKMGMDDKAMPHIHQANIACGFHAGDAIIMKRTLAMAKANGVSVGAHPAYPDLQGFGRRSMKCSKDEIIAYVQYQLSALEGLARNEDMTVDYVKPHGALYNDMIANDDVRDAVMQAVATHHSKPVLMMQATPAHAQHTEEANKYGLTLSFEAFADRCYDDDGKLLSRAKAGAVHTKEKMIAQVKQLCEQGTVTTVSGQILEVKADSLCVHGDNEEGTKAIIEIRALVDA